MAVVVALSLFGLLVQPRAPATRPRCSVRLVEADDAFFASNEWLTLALELDTCPCFAVVDDSGAPVAAECDGRRVHRYFADVAAAEAEAAALRPDQPGVDIMPVGLGTAWRAQADGTGVLVPAQADLTAAGVDGEPGQVTNLPMFACDDLQSKRLDGTPCIPLFMSAADAHQAVAEASAQNPPDALPLEVDCVSLDGAIKNMVTDPNSPQFRFIPVSASVQAIRDASGL
jgi:hypothetical protein